MSTEAPTTKHGPQSSNEIVVDVWSDVVCPWCFIGKRRLEKGVAAIKAANPEVNIKIRHRAFQLQPDIEGVVPTKVHLAEKYNIDTDKVAAMQANVCSIADGEGLCYDLENTLSGNTMDAHRVLKWAESTGVAQELLEKMYSAYFEQSRPLFTHDDILAVTDEVGLPREDVIAVLISDHYRDFVLQDQDIARQLGANGVPFFVIDMKYGISGAQPQEVFTQTLQTALSDR
jgi:predicted DsbA family dithiol-disulfide isomerase